MNLVVLLITIITWAVMLLRLLYAHVYPYASRDPSLPLVSHIVLGSIVVAQRLYHLVHLQPLQSPGDHAPPALDVVHMIYRHLIPLGGGAGGDRGGSGDHGVL